MRKNIILFLIIGFILIMAVVILLPSSGTGWSKTRESKMIVGINEARAVMYKLCIEEGRCDEFDCNYEEMTEICQKIDIAYDKEDNDSEPVIINSIPTDPKAACIYTPLSLSRDRWYCADNYGHAEETDINPASDSYCIEGKSAICPNSMTTL